MNNWKEVAHMFCGGSFYYMTTDKLSDDSERVLTVGRLDYLNKTCGINYTKLIARRVEDITDTELEKCRFIWNYDVYSPYQKLSLSAKQAIKKIIDDSRLTSDGLMYLLDMGVYPFKNTKGVILRSKND